MPNRAYTHREEVRYICSEKKFLLESTYFSVIFNESSVKNNIQVSSFNKDFSSEHIQSLFMSFSNYLFSVCSLIYIMLTKNS